MQKEKINACYGVIDALQELKQTCRDIANNDKIDNDVREQATKEFARLEQSIKEEKETIRKIKIENL